MKSVIQGKVTAECPTHSRANISVRDVGAIIDEPVERGGTNLGPSPTETGVAALVACTNTIGSKCAAKLDIDVGAMNIEATYHLDRRGVMLMEEIELPFTKIHLKIQCNGSATDQELQKVAAETRKFCALSKLFKNSGTEVTEEWVKA